jgi:ubiquinone/menaquinone biosynthesis C-methylase UbiE
LAGELLKGFGPAYLHLHASIDRFVSRADYEELLATQGFGIQRAEDLTFGIVSLVVAVPHAAGRNRP